MHVAGVMDALAERLASIGDLRGRTFAYPPSALVPPAAVVGWPDEIDYDLAMVRGGWSATFPVLVVVGKSDVRSARNAIAAHLDGAGPKSVRAALDGGAHTAYDAALVTKAHVEPVSIAGIEYLAAILDVAVTGRT